MSDLAVVTQWINGKARNKKQVYWLLFYPVHWTRISWLLDPTIFAIFSCLREWEASGEWSHAHVNNRVPGSLANGSSQVREEDCCESNRVRGESRWQKMSVWPMAIAHEKVEIDGAGVQWPFLSLLCHMCSCSMVRILSCVLHFQMSEDLAQSCTTLTTLIFKAVQHPFQVWAQFDIRIVYSGTERE